MHKHTDNYVHHNINNTVQATMYDVNHVHSQLLVYTQDKLHNNTLQSRGNSSHVCMKTGVLLPLSLQSTVVPNEKTGCHSCVHHLVPKK